MTVELSEYYYRQLEDMADRVGTSVEDVIAVMLDNGCAEEVFKDELEHNELERARAEEEWRTMTPKEREEWLRV